MAREFAKINAAIWQDDEWRDLPPMAQYLYFLILTDPDLSYCGVSDWRPNRIAPKASGLTVAAVQAAAVILTDARLLVIDEGTEEVLVRSFLRHDGVMAHNKLCVSAAMAYGAVASNAIRGVIVHELNRLKAEFPEWPCWRRQQVMEVLKRRALDPGLAPRFGAGLAPGLDDGLGPTPGAGFGSALQQQQQQQHATATGDSEESPSGARKRATRLDENWNPSTADIAWCKAEHPGIDGRAETEKFRNHWIAKSGKDATKLDWSRTWRNWIINAEQYRSRLAVVPSHTPWTPTPGSNLSYTEM